MARDGRDAVDQGIGLGSVVGVDPSGDDLEWVLRPPQIRWCLLPDFRPSTGDGPSFRVDLGTLESDIWLALFPHHTTSSIYHQASMISWVDASAGFNVTSASLCSFRLPNPPPNSSVEPASTC